MRHFIVTIMAYMNSFVTGMTLAFYVGLTLAITNGLTKRITGRSLDSQVDGFIGRLPVVGGGQ